MVLEPGGIIAWLMVGLIAGSLATQFMPRGSFGIAGDIGVGVVGAFLGGLVVSWGFQGQVGMLASVLAAFVGVVLVSRLARGLPGRSPA